jgi:hypothetical protein
MPHANPSLKRVCLDLWMSTPLARTPVRIVLPGFAKTWEDVECMIVDYAQQTYCDDFKGKWRNYTALRMLCLERLLSMQGQSNDWSLCLSNTSEEPSGFVVNVRSVLCCENEN